jgi:hypothetical protein
VGRRKGNGLTITHITVRLDRCPGLELNADHRELSVSDLVSRSLQYLVERLLRFRIEVPLITLTGYLTVQKEGRAVSADRKTTEASTLPALMTLQDVYTVVLVSSDSSYNGQFFTEGVVGVAFADLARPVP